MLFCAFYRLLAVLYSALYVTWSSLPASNVQWLLALKLSPLNDWVVLYCVKRYSLPSPFYVKEHTRGSSIYNMAEGKGEKLIEGCFLRSKKVSNQLRQFDVTWGEFDRSTAVSPLSCHSQYQTSLVQNVSAQWFPMCQFRFENYHTQIRVQIQICYEIIHSRVFSSHCPDFQPF